LRQVHPSKLYRSDPLIRHFTVFINEDGWDVFVRVVRYASRGDAFEELYLRELGGQPRQMLVDQSAKRNSAKKDFLSTAACHKIFYFNLNKRPLHVPTSG